MVTVGPDTIYLGAALGRRGVWSYGRAFPQSLTLQYTSTTIFSSSQPLLSAIPCSGVDGSSPRFELSPWGVVGSWWLTNTYAWWPETRAACS